MRDRMPTDTAGGIRMAKLRLEFGLELA